MSRLLSVFLGLLSALTLSLATEDNGTSYYVENEKVVDCLILKDENSIICKYKFPRQLEDKNVSFEWIDPNNETTRLQEVVIPAGHGSAYDFRYISGRLKGKWTFKVTDNEEVLVTTFELK